MIHSDADVLTWLRYHCSRDRILQNALNLPRSVSVSTADARLRGWAVDVVSKRGVKYRAVVVMHPVTGEPERWYRVAIGDENVTP